MKNNLNLVDEIKERGKHIKSMEQLAGKGLLMPNNPTNAGARRILQNTQTDQIFTLINPEMPILQTGYENEFGKHSSTFKVSTNTMRVIGKIYKYQLDEEDMDISHYYMIVLRDDGKYDVIERIPYEHITENFGILFNNEYLDSLDTGDYIQEGDVIKKSGSYDDANNRCDGVNLTTAYIALEHTKEDSIIISESAADKLDSPLINPVSIQINDNHVPLNIYGDDSEYQMLPDIGEEVKGGILCALRIEDSDHILFSQSRKNLKILMNSDNKYNAKGRVVDIDVYSNKPELLDKPHYAQLKYYYDEKQRFHNQVISVVHQIFEHEKRRDVLSYELSKLYSISKKVVNNTEYLLDKKKFSNIVLDVTVIETSKIKSGDKITNRYGGKGCISKIMPDEFMPVLDNGERVELVYTPASVMNRENLGLMLEQSINFMSDRLIQHIRSAEPNSTLDEYNKWVIEAFELIVDYIGNISESMGNYLYRYGSFHDQFKEDYVRSILKENKLVISVEPLSEVMDINTLERLHKSFNFEPYRVQVPMKNSYGQYRMVKCRRSIVCSKQYIWRLKQYSEDKLSAVSLSSTNIRGENSKSKSKKMNKTMYARTCIRFGNMETGNLLHLSPDIVVANLMMNSLSPRSRREFIQLLKGDVFNIDIRLTSDASNRAVEILNTKFKSLGLALNFKKVTKPKLKPLFVQDKVTPLFTQTYTTPLFVQTNPTPLFVQRETTPLFVHANVGEPFIVLKEDEE